MTRRLTLIFLLSCGSFLLQTCTEVDPAPGQGLTVNIDPGYFLNDTDVWIFISDKRGTTLDVRQATDSTRVRFSGIPRSTVTLTIFMRIALTSGGDGTVFNSFGLNSYQGISSGSTIHLKQGTNNNTGSPPDVIGSAPFTLQGYDDADHPEESLIITDGIASPFTVLDYSSTEYDGATFSSQLNLREDPSDILLATYRDDLPVYQWLNAVKPGVEEMVSFDSFLPMETIPINKQVYLGEVKTMQGTDFSVGYIFSSMYSRYISKSSNLQELPKLGYLDGFEKYFVHAVLNPFHAPTNVYYTKAGTVPSSITFPDYTYSVNNDNLYGLSVTFSNTHSYKLAYFIQSNSEMQVHWSLHASDTEDFRAPALPGEIMKRYPMLTVEGLKLQFARYTHRLDGYTYEDYLDDHLATVTKSVYDELAYVVTP
jgi:hypothetical protein